MKSADNSENNNQGVDWFEPVWAWLGSILGSEKTVATSNVRVNFDDDAPSAGLIQGQYTRKAFSDAFTNTYYKTARTLSEGAVNLVVVFAFLGVAVGISALAGSTAPLLFLSYLTFALGFLTGAYFYFRTFASEMAKHDGAEIARLEQAAEEASEGTLTHKRVWVRLYKLVAFAWRALILAGILAMGYFSFAPAVQGGFLLALQATPQDATSAAIFLALGGAVISAVLLRKFYGAYPDLKQQVKEKRFSGMLSFYFFAGLRAVGQTMATAFKVLVIAFFAIEKPARQRNDESVAHVADNEDEGKGQELEESDQAALLSAEESLHPAKGAKKNQPGVAAHTIGMINGMLNAAFVFAITYYVSGSPFLLAAAMAGFGLLISFFVTRYAVAGLLAAVADGGYRQSLDKAHPDKNLKSTIKSNKVLFATLFVFWMAVSLVMNFTILELHGQIEALVAATGSSVATTVMVSLASAFALALILSLAYQRLSGTNEQRPQMLALFTALTVNTSMLSLCYLLDVSTMAMVCSIAATALMTFVTAFFLASKVGGSLVQSSSASQAVEDSASQVGAHDKPAQKAVNLPTLLAASSGFFLMLACLDPVLSPQEGSVLGDTTSSTWGMDQDVHEALAIMLTLLLFLSFYIIWRLGPVSDIEQDCSTAQKSLERFDTFLSGEGERGSSDEKGLLLGGDQ